MDYKVIPNSGFSISRTAHKDSSSSYYIDGKKSNFKDVTTRLKDCGVDLDHNRFLILQVRTLFCVKFLFFHVLNIYDNMKGLISMLLLQLYYYASQKQLLCFSFISLSCGFEPHHTSVIPEV